MKSLRAGAIVIAGVYFALAMHHGKAHAQNVHEQIRLSLVHLKATGQVGSDPNTSQEIQTFATGFLISSDGLVLTTHQLISELGDVQAQTVGIEARIGDKSADIRPAAIIDANTNADLLLLKLPPPSGDDYLPAQLGDAYEYDYGDVIYTSGFPEDISYKTDDGKIEATEGPARHAYLWTTDMKFEDGLSGSPIYNDEGKVLGISKSLGSGALSMIPIGFPDALIAQVRLRDIKTAMDYFNPLRAKMDWSGEYITAHSALDPGTLKVMYDKLLPGEPLVEKIDVFVKPEGVKEGEARPSSPPENFEALNVAPTGTTDAGGVFILPDDLVETIRENLREGDYERLTKYRIRIVARLTNGNSIDDDVTVDVED